MLPIGLGTENSYNANFIPSGHIGVQENGLRFWYAVMSVSSGQTACAPLQFTFWHCGPAWKHTVLP